MQIRKSFLYLCLGLFLCILFSHPAHAEFKYPLLEQFPGFFNAGSTPTFPDLLSAVYKFGIWTVGIAAFFMLTVGGFLYATSAGNTASISSAKNIITDALWGLVMALAAYLLLYVINPDLVNLNLNLISVGLNTATTPGVVGGGVYMGYEGSTKKIPGGCKNEELKGMLNNAARQVGKDACLILALAATETSCQTGKTSPKGACGIVQFKPETAKKYGFSGSNQDICKQMDADPQKAIIAGAKYLFSHEKLVRGSINNSEDKSRRQAIRDLYAAYNGGPGALGASSNCAGQKNEYGFEYRKWDCPVGQGGYKETERATATFLKFYTDCRNNKML